MIGTMAIGLLALLEVRDILIRLKAVTCTWCVQLQGLFWILILLIAIKLATDYYTKDDK